jgi:hypothetical protein
MSDHLGEAMSGPLTEPEIEPELKEQYVNVVLVLSKGLSRCGAESAKYASR